MSSRENLPAKKAQERMLIRDMAGRRLSNRQVAAIKRKMDREERDLLTEYRRWAGVGGTE